MNEERWTVRRMLRWMTEDFTRLGAASPRLDAELLIAAALGAPRVQLYLDMDRPLAPQELSAIKESVRRRRTHEPVAYILGTREFYGRPFLVDGRVLVPRPDTERLIDEALSLLPADRMGPTALDLCTGSGCIGLTLAAERPQLEVTVTDVSTDALAVARNNADRLHVAERCRLLQGDLFDAVAVDARYDLIACNPPYVRADEIPGLAPEVRDHEPRLALVAEEQGLAFYRRLSQEAADHLKPGGHLLLEVGQGQATPVMAMLQGRGFEDISSLRDLGAMERVVRARRG